MKKIVFTLTLVALIGMSPAALTENGTPTECRGDMCIMNKASASSASATTSVGPNGTEYKSELSMTGSTCLEPPAQNISDISYSQDNSSSKVSFQGELQTPTPCYTLEQETTEIGVNMYRMNFTTASSGSGPCVQCLGAISYNASFETNESFKLEVVHEGEKVEELEHPDYQNGSDTGEGNEQVSFTSKVMNWFRGLF